MLEMVLARLQELGHEATPRPMLAADASRTGLAELLQVAGGLAHEAERELPPGSVMVAADDARTLVVGAIAALSAGRPFLPLDGRMPLDVIERRAEAAGTVGLFAAPFSPLRPLARDLRLGVLSVGEHGPRALKIVGVGGGRSATIAFTSGTTGEPVPHVRSRDRFARGIQQPTELQLTKGDRHGMLLGATPTVVRRILGALLHGADVICLDARSTRSVDILGRYASEGVTTLSVVPTYLRQLLAACRGSQVLPELRSLHSGSEPLDWLDIERVRERFARDVTVVHTYGSTETAGRIAERYVPPTEPVGDGRLPVGRPVAGVRIGILGDDDSEVPTGTTGRIVVTTPDGRLTRLNDLGRIGAAGELELLGRTDAMVKVGGIRVELGQLESITRRIVGVVDAVARIPGEAADSSNGADHAFIDLHIAVDGRDGGEATLEAVREAVCRLEHARGVVLRLHLHVGSVPQLLNGKRDPRRLAGSSASGVPISIHSHETDGGVTSE